MDKGPESVADAGELAQIRRQGRTVQWKSLAVAATLTALSLLVPALR